MDRVFYQRDSLIIVDGFYPEPKKIRAAALAQDFGDAEHKDTKYPGVGLNVPDSALRWDLVSEAVGFEADPARYEDRDVTFFRLGEEGDTTTSWIHADTGMDAEWAAICYLSEPESPRSGTAFWMHRETGLHTLPPDLEKNQLEVFDLHGQDRRHWAPTALANQAFNRLVAFPTARFHSRWPRDVAGKGAEGRLIQVFFFNRGDRWM